MGCFWNAGLLLSHGFGLKMLKLSIEKSQSFISHHNNIKRFLA
tara:strand:- start:474 stop:602 length:129 start_codon:yes stop_codon:yes gene_type:complete